MLYNSNQTFICLKAFRIIKYLKILELRYDIVGIVVMRIYFYYSKISRKMWGSWLSQKSVLGSLNSILREVRCSSIYFMWWQAVLHYWLKLTLFPIGLIPLTLEDRFQTSSLQQALSLRTSSTYLLSLGYKLAKATLKECLFDIDGQTVAGNATHLSIGYILLFHKKNLFPLNCIIENDTVYFWFIFPSYG